MLLCFESVLGQSDRDFNDKTLINYSENGDTLKSIFFSRNACEEKSDTQSRFKGIFGSIYDIPVGIGVDFYYHEKIITIKSCYINENYKVERFYLSIDMEKVVVIKNDFDKINNVKELVQFEKIVKNEAFLHYSENKETLKRIVLSCIICNESESLSDCKTKLILLDFDYEKSLVTIATYYLNEVYIVEVDMNKARVLKNDFRK
jgi:hypothetical protein